MEPQITQLSDFEEQVTYTPATSGQRFANYLVDMVIFYVIVFVLLLGLLFTASDPEYAADQAENNVGMQYMVGLPLLFLYYFLMEFAFKGRTIGKFITGTKVIKISGEPITAGDAALRSVCRLVPFDAISFLAGGGSGWHDKWSKTTVVKIQK